MISARAYGVLCYLSAHPDKISADELSKVFKESRKPFLAALKELREAGFIVTKKERIGSNWMTVSRLRESPFGSSEMALLIPQNSNNKVILHSQDYKPTTPTESVKEEPMPYEFFESTSSMDDDDRVSERSKYMAAKKTEYQERRAKNANKKFIDRNKIPVKNWSSADVAYEFADRVHDHWHIQPWSVTKSRFIIALSTARKQHDTDGELEVEAMKRFFDSISIEKYDDAEILWKMFIKRFPMFIGQIRNMVMPDSEATDAELLRNEKSRSRLYDDV